MGAGHFARTVEVIKDNNYKMIVEALTPDFNAMAPLVKKVVDARVDVFAHNIETVERLSPRVRDRRSNYRQSLKTLAIAKKLNRSLYTKSSLMLGLGEEESEVRQSLQDLREVGCDVVTFGQYLAPTNRHKKYLPIVEYIHPERFQYFQQMAEEMGFLYVASGPLVRSSYRAGEFFLKGVIRKQRKQKQGENKN